MGMPVKLSDELVASARTEAASTDRSITGQIEHWAKIGRSVAKHRLMSRHPLEYRFALGRGAAGTCEQVHCRLTRRNVTPPSPRAAEDDVVKRSEQHGIGTRFGWRELERTRCFIQVIDVHHRQAGWSHWRQTIRGEGARHGISTTNLRQTTSQILHAPRIEE